MGGPVHRRCRSSPDLLVVTASHDYGDIVDAVRPVTHVLGIDINPVVVSPKPWAATSDDPFLTTILDRPMVALPPGDEQ